MINISDRLTELDVILEYMDNSDWSKIPDDIIFYIEENKNNNYVWVYDETKPLEEQQIHKDTFALLSYIAYKYIATPEEKEQMKKIFQENTDILNEKYSVDNLFNKSKTNIIDESTIAKNISSETTAIVPIKKESIFYKIKAFFKKLFN